MQIEGPQVRDMVQQRPDRARRGQAHLHELEERAGSPVELAPPSSDVLYHPSPIVEALLPLEPGPYGDAVVFPSRLEGLKRSRSSSRRCGT